MNQPHHFLQRFKLMKLFSVFGSPGHTFNIGRRVASHFPNGHLFALKRHKSSGVTTGIFFPAKAAHNCANSQGFP